MAAAVPQAERPPPGRKTGRPAQRRLSPLIEPIEIAKFFKNRKGEVIGIEPRSFEGHDLLDLGQLFTDAEGRLRPTKKGICIAVRQVPDLAQAIEAALAEARELGLIELEGEQ